MATATAAPPPSLEALGELAPLEWKVRADAHRHRITSLCGGSLHQDARNPKHPIFNFLFQYYFYKPQQVAAWSPGFNVVCAGAGHNQVQHSLGTQRKAVAVGLPGGRQGLVFDGSRCERKTLDGLRRVLDLLRATEARPPVLNCFGLHEWAMLYHPATAASAPHKHQNLPLRVSQETLNELVETRTPLRCTHFDAFRFFTPAAAPRNAVELTREVQVEHEQPACIHTNMDLFKYAMKLSPWLPAEEVGDCFELAREARIVDMRASPYDVSAFSPFEGQALTPIRVETVAGRQEYRDVQIALWRKASPLRQRLIDRYAAFLDHAEALQLAGGGLVGGKGKAS